MPHRSENLTKLGEFLTEHMFARMIISWIGYGIVFAFGEITQAHYALFALMMLDVITGVLKAAKQGRLRSCKLFIGMFRKIVMYMIFLSAIHLTTIISPQLMFFKDWALLFLGATELLSVVENLTSLGFLIPPWLEKYLHQILDKEEIDTK